jgi:cyclopropane-fatty-acyl-phospholipid synthase
MPTPFIESLIARRLIPEFLIRTGIRHLLRRRLNEESSPNPTLALEKKMRFIEELKSLSIAIETQSANDQHYEVPAAFFEYILGKHRKYSSGYWTEETHTLDHAEENMLHLTCKRARLENHHHILELGCGWGALTLYMAQHYPQAIIHAVSNSHSQRRYIESQCQKRGITNVTIHTADINHFTPPGTYDRIVSVEMFEHVKNYHALLERISKWLKDEGKLFIHIFTHLTYAYHFNAKDATDWISKYFFTGGTMPSDDLLLYFQDHLAIENHWRICGKHYQRTAEAWLKNMRHHAHAIRPILAQTYGKENLALWFSRWEIFFMACAELWGMDNGWQWLVSHYLMKKKTSP